jgi:hypothetical protein
MIHRTIELDEMDSEIAAYERLTSDELRLELDRRDIDPQATIESVKTLVIEYLRRRDRAGRRR